MSASRARWRYARPPAHPRASAARTLVRESAQVPRRRLPRRTSSRDTRSAAHRAKKCTPAQAHKSSSSCADTAAPAARAHADSARRWHNSAADFRIGTFRRIASGRPAIAARTHVHVDVALAMERHPALRGRFAPARRRPDRCPSRSSSTAILTLPGKRRRASAAPRATAVPQAAQDEARSRPAASSARVKRV